MIIWYVNFKVQELRQLYRDVMARWMWHDVIDFCRVTP